MSTVAEVIKLISAADPSLGQIPQNHLGVVDILLQTASEEQKRYYFGKVLAGYRFGNAFSEAKSKNAGTFDTQIRVPRRSARKSMAKSSTAPAHCSPISCPRWAITKRARRSSPSSSAMRQGLTVIDSWDGFGQRTTASGGVTLDGVTRARLSAVIPAHLAFDQPTADGPISQIIQAAVDTGIALGALEQAKIFARQARPWIDSQQDHGWQDPFTIAAIGDLEWRVHGTEAILAKAGIAVDQALAEPNEDTVANASLIVAQAKVLSAETALLASSKLFELGGTRSVTGKHNLDRFWRNARTHTLHDPVRWKYHLIGNFVLNGAQTRTPCLELRKPAQ